MSGLRSEDGKSEINVTAAGRWIFVVDYTVVTKVNGQRIYRKEGISDHFKNFKEAAKTGLGAWYERKSDGESTGSRARSSLSRHNAMSSFGK